jgi:hypothetical protein
MSAAREALVLPILFLTATLLGGLQPGTQFTLAGPSLFSLILAAMLLAALVRSGAVTPERLLHASRGPLANANGSVVLLTLFAASAQLLTLLTPRSGLPLFFVDIFLFVLLWNTLITMPDRGRLLRSLAVILGAAFVLKFVILAGLADPAGSRVRRVLVALFDAGTFGTMSQEAQHPASGYLAFLAAALFLIGVATLPTRAAQAGNGLQRTSGMPGVNVSERRRE